MKRSAALCLLLCAALCLTACAGQTYSDQGLSLELSGEFTRETREPYTACYRSGELAVFTLRQEFELFQGGDVEVDLPFFAAYMLEQYGGQGQVCQEDGLTWFRFAQGGYAHYIFAYEAADAFWIVEFSCSETAAENLENTIFTAAKTVKV